MPNASWRRLYRAGAAAALLALLVGVSEIGITFLPGGRPWHWSGSPSSSARTAPCRCWR